MVCSESVVLRCTRLGILNGGNIELWPDGVSGENLFDS